MIHELISLSDLPLMLLSFTPVCCRTALSTPHGKAASLVEYQSQQKPETRRALHISFFAPFHILSDDTASANFATLLGPLLPDDSWMLGQSRSQHRSLQDSSGYHSPCRKLTICSYFCLLAFNQLFTHKDQEDLLSFCMVWWVDPGWRPSAHQICSVTPLLSWTGERKYNERLMGRDKDREITQ